MMEKLGVPKTHLEMKKMIAEVTGGCSAAIDYRNFISMFLGPRSSILKMWVYFLQMWIFLESEKYIYKFRMLLEIHCKIETK